MYRDCVTAYAVFASHTIYIMLIGSVCAYFGVWRAKSARSRRLATVGFRQGPTASRPVRKPRTFGEQCESFTSIKGKCDIHGYTADHGQKSGVASLSSGAAGRSHSESLQVSKLPSSLPPFRFSVKPAALNLNPRPLSGENCPPNPDYRQDVLRYGLCPLLHSRKIWPASRHSFPRRSAPLRSLHNPGRAEKRETVSAAVPFHSTSPATDSQSGTPLPAEPAAPPEKP